MCPDERYVDEFVRSPAYTLGHARNWWRQIDYAFPYLVIGVAHVSPDRVAGETAFRFELSNYPTTAPWAQVWDAGRRCILEQNKRPSWDARTREAFKNWNPSTGISCSIYRPWDRYGLNHNNWAQRFPNLAWHSGRNLTFALDDLKAILTGTCEAFHDAA